jgi:hypothetical protein
MERGFEVGGWLAGATAVALIALTASAPLHAQPNRGADRPRPEVEGSAVVRVDEAEYTIPILCFDAADVSAGFSTEPSRITRERVGRTSGVNLRAGLVPDHSDEVVINLDRYVAWIARPAAGAVLTLELDMSPVTRMVEGVPTLLQRDEWWAGDRPEGLSGAWFEARCDARDPDAPSFRRIGG